MNVLSDIRVLDLGSFITGPYCAMLLAELGADVVKIERPGTGDPFRAFRQGLYSAHFQAHNRAKHSLTLDYTKPAGLDVLYRLVEQADVVVANQRPGVAERTGTDPATLMARNPRLIHCSITGFGNDGPYADRPAYDNVGQSLSGLLSLFHTGDDPRVAGPALSDAVTGLFAAYGVLGALHERAQTHRGRRIDVNMLESTIAFATEPLGQHFSGVRVEPYTRASYSQSFVVACADRKRIGLHLSSPEKFWDGLLRAIERPELGRDPRFATRALRVENYASLGAELQLAFARRSRDAWTTALEANDVPFAPALELPELADDPQVRHLRTFYEMSHPTQGRVTGIRRPVRYDGADAPEAAPPPVLGEHTDAVLTAAGLTSRDIASLRDQGIV